MNIDWDGEGLPPVGVTCERRFDDLEDSSWQIMTVIAYGKRKVFYSDRNGEEWGHFTSELEFRVLKTKAQVAAEKREKAIDRITEDLNLDSINRYIAARAYDAGYRKFEIVEEDV